MPTELLLSPHSATPMYAQIVEQVVAKVMTGEWKAGDALPSIRELAGNSQVSVITVKRAYLELERAGVIVTRQGKPSVVILSLEDYEALTETADLLRSPANARRLLDAIDELNAGKGREHALNDEAAVRDPSMG